jgi:hypothetical protein
VSINDIIIIVVNFTITKAHLKRLELYLIVFISTQEYFSSQEIAIGTEVLFLGDKCTDADKIKYGNVSLFGLHLFGITAVRTITVNKIIIIIIIK